jgi:hypothetical protein
VLTHLGEAGASLLELMAESWHRKAENPRRHFKRRRPNQFAPLLLSFLESAAESPKLARNRALGPIRWTCPRVSRFRILFKAKRSTVTR